MAGLKMWRVNSDARLRCFMCCTPCTVLLRFTRKCCAKGEPAGDHNWIAPSGHVDGARHRSTRRDCGLRFDERGASPAAHFETEFSIADHVARAPWKAQPQPPCFFRRYSGPPTFWITPGRTLPTPLSKRFTCRRDGGVIALFVVRLGSADYCAAGGTS